MPMKRAFIVHAAVLLAGISCGHAWAADSAAIALHYGSNPIHFGDGDAAGTALLAHRENFNAHGFDVLTLYQKDWQLISVFDDDKEVLLLTAGGGADCVLHDFRLVRDQGGGVRLIVAERDFGNGYADAATVRFKFYALRRNDDGDIGYPSAYFKLIERSVAKKTYCDVGEAFKTELNIGPYRQ
jgi:hypothetical protein